MALKGCFRKHLAVLPDGTQRNIYSLVIHNTGWIGHEKIMIRFYSIGAVNSAAFDVDLKAGQSIELDIRNTGWDWCMGDYAAVIDKKGNVKERWDFQPTVYRPGACPDCHGTHRCTACQGRGRWTDRQRNYVYCPSCHGTGQCQTCYVPVRGAADEGFPSMAGSGLQETPKRHHRAVAVIQGDIKRKERELEQVNRNLENRTNPQPTQAWQSNWPYPGTTVYVKPKGDFGSYTFSLARRTAQLESELRELYQELAEAEADK